MTLRNNKWGKVIAVSLTIVVIGSLWGLVEMTLGGFLHAIHLPQKGAIMGGLAISFMAFFVTITKKPLFVPLIGIIAASFKPFDAIIFGVPVLSPYVINPSVAIIMEALAFTGVVFVFKNAFEKHMLARVGAGISAGPLGYVFYVTFAMIFGWGIWPTLAPTETLQLILINATPMAIAGAIVMSAGYQLGRATLPTLSTFNNLHAKLYYSTSLALVVLCWTIPIVFPTGA